MEAQQPLLLAKTTKKVMPAFFVMAVFFCGAILLLYYHPYAFNPYAFGFFFGYVIQRSRFCFAACFRDIFLIRNASLTRALIVATAVATAGFCLVSLLPGHPGLEIAGRVQPVGLHTMAGGIIFGFGMVIAGSCVSGCLVRIGEGYLMQAGTFAGLLVGSLLGAWHLNWLIPKVINHSPIVFMPRYLGWPGALLLQLLVLTCLFFLTIRVDGARNLRSTFRLSAGPGTSWPYGIGGVLLGLGNTGLFALWGKPWGITSGLTHFAGWLAKSIGIPVAKWQYFAAKAVVTESYGTAFLAHPLVYLSLAMVLGSLVSSILYREFRIRRPRLGRYYYLAVVGGIMMGYGSRLSFGCNIGTLFSGISSLSLHGWVFGFALAAGAYFGGRFLVRYII